MPIRTLGSQMIFAADPFYAERPAPCTQRCEKILAPVCAEDESGRNRTYPNECMIGFLNCQEKTKSTKIADGECPDDPIVWVDDEAYFDQYDMP
ncbi:Ovoinhibitor [Frankliniella fusca]|uniref:Ovoinhibitor n=1 Tax=Frankliniella fusca TaxID=407009 RepID=A0AAE1HWW2_9NEOP|nr:Ovoinhibitor [Frankliniella fusca]